MNESMRYVVRRGLYDAGKKIIKLRKYVPGDRLIVEFLGYPKGRMNVTYIPWDNIDNPPQGDVYPIPTVVIYYDLRNLEWINRSYSHPIRYDEHKILSYFQEAEYQISLSGIIEVFKPKVWTIVILFLFLFNFLTIAKRLVPRVRRFIFGVSDNLGDRYEAAKKVILATYFVGCFILMEIFKANLSTKLTVDIDRNINIYDDIFKYPNMRISIQHGAILQEYHKDHVLEFERRFRKMNQKKGDNDDVFNQGNAVYIGTVHHLEYFCLHGYRAGKALHYGRDIFLSCPVAFQVSKAASTTVKDLINIRIMNFWETGHKIRANSLLTKNACSKYLKTKQGLTFSKMSLGDFGAIILVYLSSMMISFLVMLVQLRHAFNN